MAKSQRKNIVKKRLNYNKMLISSYLVLNDIVHLILCFLLLFLLQVLSKYSARNINYFGDQGNVLN